MTGSAAEETVLWQGRPALRSFWVFIFGMLLCGVGPFIQDEPPLGPKTGLILAAIFLMLILVRWAHEYTLTDRCLVVESGLIRKETTEIPLADIHSVDVHQGFGLRVVGAGHLMVRSKASNQSAVIIYGQLRPHDFQERLMGLSRGTQNSAMSSTDGGDDAPDEPDQE